jgi:hypothetical protein
MVYINFPTDYEAGTFKQGDLIEARIPITNHSEGVSKLDTAVGCTCTSIEFPNGKSKYDLQANETVEAIVRVKTGGMAVGNGYKSFQISWFANRVYSYEDYHIRYTIEKNETVQK